MNTVQLAQELSIDDIMDRLSRLCRMGTRVMCRSKSPSGLGKWYVTMSGVREPYTCSNYSGATPEEAIRKTWATIATAADDGLAFVRYFCKPDESIPGNGPQVWVRWSVEKDDWEDVNPPLGNTFASWASEIRQYKEHKWMEKLN